MALENKLNCFDVLNAFNAIREPEDWSYSEAVKRVKILRSDYEVGRSLFRIVHGITNPREESDNLAQINSEIKWDNMFALKFANNSKSFNQYVSQVQRERRERQSSMFPLPRESIMLRGYALEAVSFGELDTAIDVLAKSNGEFGFDGDTLRAIAMSVEGDFEKEIAVAEKIVFSLKREL